MSRGELRSSARLGAVQALYQMEIAGKDLGDVIAEFEAHWLGQIVDDIEMKPAESAFFRSLVEGVVKDQRTIDLKLMRPSSVVGHWQELKPCCVQFCAQVVSSCCAAGMCPPKLLSVNMATLLALSMRAKKWV